MSTRSRIGLLMPDDSIYSVYCHYDGYYEGVGALLDEHYDDLVSARKIVDLGDISSLGLVLSIPPGIKHTFGFPNPGVTVAYGRDRGDKDTDAVHSANMKEFLKLANDTDAEYVYLYDVANLQWYASSSYLQFGDKYDPNKTGVQFKPLKVILLDMFSSQRTEEINEMI